MAASKASFRYVLHAMLAGLALGHAAPVVAAPDADSFATRVANVLRRTPLIDGHNDWTTALERFEGQNRWTVDLNDLSGRANFYHTDISRLRRGMLGGQFWAIYAPADLPQLDQVKITFDQIDLVRQIVARYPETFALARTAAEVRRIHRSGRIASLMGVEGGGQIDNDLSILRAYHALGVGYLTLTHVRNTDWADSSNEDPRHGGLAPFGRAVVQELNRLGMLVDISHVSPDTMRAAIAASRAPVFYSHSSARALTNHARNVPDEVLRLVAADGGVVMVNALPQYVSEPLRRWNADRAGSEARIRALNLGQPERVRAELEAWERANPRPVATLRDVADHIEHIARVAGVDHVGIGADFWGGPGPEGFEDVSRYPALLAELMRRGWTDADIAKVVGENVLRVMEAAENVAAAMNGEAPGNPLAPGSRAGQ